MDNSEEAERKALASIESTYPALDGWQERLSAEPFTPEPGSALAHDDDDWPYMSVSHVAWTGLAAATDHLTAIRRHIEATYLFGLSHPSLCRTALIGAAQAVWVLAPAESEVRIERARCVAVYVYENHIKYLTALSESAKYTNTNAVAQLNTDKKRLAEIQAKRKADGQKQTLKTTHMIEAAAKAAFNRDALTQEALMVWQSGSGAAHGQMWHLYGTPAMRPSSAGDSTGMANFMVGGSLTVISNPFCAAFELAKRGWDFLDRRGKTIRFSVGARSYRHPRGS
jgi:hypothetical protein